MTLTQKTLTDAVTQYYDGQRDDRNYILGSESGIINHHFGIGDFDRQVPVSELDITQVLHQLELQQIETLFEFMQPVTENPCILDAGSGRGGTSFWLAERTRGVITGITISSYQREFAEKLRISRNVDNVSFNLMNYLDTTFLDESFDAVVTNETTQYTLDLKDLFSEFARILKKGRKYTCATWCKADNLPAYPNSEKIDKNYGTYMHQLQEYTAGLRACGFKILRCEDYTELALPYWELRQHWGHRSGVEPHFIEGHRTREVLYYFISATKL